MSWRCTRTTWRTSRSAGQAILAGLGAKEGDRLRPRVLYSDVMGDAHAVIVNRTREASMLLPGQSLLGHEVTPALFAAVAANEAERAAPDATQVDVWMIGAAGRVYPGGTPDGVRPAAAPVDEVLAAVEGREPQ